MNIYRITLAGGALCAIGALQANEPAGYYTSCEGKTGKALLQQLESVIDDHKVVSYDNLYDVYDDSDRHPDGTIWDMYSTKNWGKNFSSVKCGNYSLVGDCINKEHSFPKSWFNDKSPMVSDAFHIYPTDGKVNGQRSNYPYGECANGTYLPANGSAKPLGRLGTSTFAGYSGKVFEPDDEYKGDFARTYFYMATRYNSSIAGWNSAMLAGNNYPAFSTWALNLLLKWHRQDPVSEKEITRNDAVYGHQHNRNPYIDHPELVEYIWGEKNGQAWSLSLGADPAFITPVNNSTVDLGLTAVGIERQTTVTVTAANLTADATVTITGNGFSASAATLSKSALNGAGAALTLSYKATAAGKANGKAVITSGDATLTLNLLAEAVNGLPVLPASYVSSESFTANWVCIDPAGTKYTLDVRRDNASVEGYPRQVDAAAGSYRVEDLEPETTYTYTVASASLTSTPMTVTTSAPIPNVSFYYDGELSFTAITGDPSDVAEILVDIENIPGDVIIGVTAPFELSLDKQQWQRSVILAPGADRFYMRLLSSAPGEFTTTLRASADDYLYDDVEVKGIVSEPGATFIEDFEKKIPDGESKGYGALTYEGNAAIWATDNAYFEYAGANSYPHSGNQAVRFNKSGVRHITMLQDKADGIGTVSFWACPWRQDAADCTIDVCVSADHGQTWQTVGSVTVHANGGQTNEYDQYSVAVNRSGALRLKLEQTAGARCMVDDIAMTGYRQSGLQLTPEGHAYHSWDAYCLDGQLAIENSDADNIFSVYSLDGREVFVGKILAGEGVVMTLPVPAGLYIVNVCDFARRVLVR